MKHFLLEYLCSFRSDQHVSSKLPRNTRVLFLFTVVQTLEQQKHHFPDFNYWTIITITTMIIIITREYATILIKSRLLTRALSLWASEVPFPSEGSSSTWSEPHCTGSTNTHTHRGSERGPGGEMCSSAEKGGFSPADGAINPAHDEHGGGEVPRVAHGDEHHVAVIL